MRIKFLLVIVSFFFVLFVVILCFDIEEIEYSLDVIIYVFVFDIIYGVNYKFIID